MPAAVPYVSAFVYGAAAGASAGILAAAAIGAVVQTILVNAALGALGKALGPKSAGGNRAPLNVTIRSATASRSVIFGSVRAGGVVVFYSCSGTNNKYLHYVIAYAGHQCNAIKDIWIDTVQVLHANINAGTGAVTQAPFTGKLYIWRYTGTSSQAADADLVSEFSGTWDTTAQLKGITYGHIRMERDDTAFPQGPPGSVTARVEGAKLYDPRLDTTNGGSGSHLYTDATTWTYPTNPSPALALRWILTGGSVTTDVATPLVKYGLKDLNSRLPDAYTIAAANICDEVLTGANTTPAGDEYRYSLNIELTTGQTVRDWIEDVLAAMAGTCLPVNGKWRMYAGDYDAPVHVLTDADVYGDIQIQDTSGHEDRYNAVAAVFRDSVNEFVEATTEFRTDSAYETQDGGERLPKELSLPGVTTDAQAQRLCEIEKRKSRLMRTVKIVGSLNLLKIAPWETFTFSNTKYGWSNRVFRCLERQIVYMEDAGRVEITARVESSSVYTDMVTADYTTPNTHTPIYNMELPDPPTSLTAVSVLRGIEFTVGLPAYLDANTVVELWEYTSSTPFASATKVAEFRASVFTLAKLDTTTRYYWVRMISKATQEVSLEYPTSAAGVAGVALPSTRTYYLDDAGPISMTGSGNIKTQSVTITAEEEVEVTVSGIFNVTATTGASSGAQASIRPNVSGQGQSLTFYNFGAGIDLSGQPFTLVGLYKGSDIGAGTYDFGLGVKITQSPAGPPYLTIEATEVSVRVTVIAL